MADLAQDFFKRDLNDAEWAHLGRQLASEDAVADRFIEQAAGYYASLGLPEPTPPKGGVGGLGGGGLLGGHAGLILGVLLGAASGVAAGWYLRGTLETGAPAPATVQSTATEPAAPTTAAAPIAATPITRAGGEPQAEASQPMRRAAPTPLSQPTLAPPPAGPAPAREASPGFPGLAAVVELQRQGLVTARVLDAKGEEQRLLYAGVLEPGRWSFGWDGMDLAGRHVAAGVYTIEVQEGSRVLRKQVAVSAHRGSTP